MGGWAFNGWLQCASIKGALLGFMALAGPCPGKNLGALATPQTTPVAKAFPPEQAPLPRPPGIVFVLSAPSGTGKSTCARRLLQQVPGLVFAVSHTTRRPRPGEVDGKDYLFVDDAAFDALQAKGDFAEWVALYGHRYGLSKDWIRKQLASGKDILMDLDPTGTRAVRQAVPEAVTVFLLPPSARELAARLRGRGSENEAQLTLRLRQAGQQLCRYGEYDYLVINQTVDQACHELEAIVLAARARQPRRAPAARQIIESFNQP